MTYYIKQNGNSKLKRVKVQIEQPLLRDKNPFHKAPMQTFGGKYVHVLLSDQKKNAYSMLL